MLSLELMHQDDNEKEILRSRDQADDVTYDLARARDCVQKSEWMLQTILDSFETVWDEKVEMLRARAADLGNEIDELAKIVWQERW